VKVRNSLIVLVFMASSSACYMGDPIPVECVCQCQEEGSKAEVSAQAAPTPKALPELTKAKSRDALRAKRLAAKKAAANAMNPLAKRVSDTKRRADSRVAKQPGSGEVLEVDPRTKVSMLKTYSGLLRNTSSRKLEPMKPFLTERLYTSLEKNLPKYEERFFNGLKESVGALGKGDLKVKETRDMGRGNVEAQIVFANGHERRVIFLKEGDGWKLNRL